MKMTAPRSPKFRKLGQLTGLGKRELIGTLELLWLFTMEHAPAADIGKWSDSDIEFECDWHGEKGALIAALVESGWLDECHDHRLVVHDWEDHLPAFLRVRVSRGTLYIVAATPHKSPEGDIVRRSSNASTTIVEREGKGSQGKGSVNADDSPPAAVTHEFGNLINVLSKLDGDGNEKLAWLESEFSLISAEAEADPKPNRIRPITIRYYRQYLKGDREFKNLAAKRARKKLMDDWEAEFADDMREIEEDEGHATAHR